VSTAGAPLRPDLLMTVSSNTDVAVVKASHLPDEPLIDVNELRFTADRAWALLRNCRFLQGNAPLRAAAIQASRRFLSVRLRRFELSARWQYSTTCFRVDWFRV
jgi:hypothetical protein